MMITQTIYMMKQWWYNNNSNVQSNRAVEVWTHIDYFIMSFPPIAVLENETPHSKILLMEN